MTAVVVVCVCMRVCVCAMGKETKHDTHYGHVRRLVLCGIYRWHRSRWEKKYNNITHK